MSLLPVGIGSSGDYEISRSVRLRSSASAYFSRTFGTPTNSILWTYSAWIKRGVLSASQFIFYARDSAGTNNRLLINLDSSNALSVYLYRASDGAYPIYLYTTAVFRDPSAWYHVQIAYDSANATTTNRVRIYVNGVLQTISGTVTTTPSTTPSGLAIYPTSSLSGVVNTAVSHDIGRESATPSGYLDGYLTDINFIDGQALDASYFGETDAVTGVWKPKKYTGTYGTNGFYLNFSDNSAATAAAIGKDYSGNGNNWTPNNISVTAGTTYDSMLDVPTQWADGGNGRGNYATLNPLDVSLIPFSNGNLTGTSPSSHNGSRATMMLPTSGKYYWEATTNSNVAAGNEFLVGVANRTASLTAWTPTGVWGGYGPGGPNVFSNNAFGSTYSPMPSMVAGVVWQVAYDAATQNIWIGYNNVWYTSAGANTGNPSAGTGQTATASGEVFPYFEAYNLAFNVNFGQRPFAYTPPTGFKAMNTLNLPEPTILKGNQYFDATTYTGNGTSLSVTNSGSMQPDLVWIKQRNTTRSHRLHDSVRGVSKQLFPDTTGAETSNTDELTSFNSDGFTLSTSVGVNASAGTYVGWQWKEGAMQGFDIVTYTGTGSNTTVAHSLGVAPSMLIFKPRNAADNWPVWHKAFAVDEYVYLNLANAKASLSTFMNSTLPDSSNITLGTWRNTNNNTQTMVCYAFSEVAGFSKFGSYVGNGSADGPFAFCGFRPRWIMVKRADSTSNWTIHDTSRDDYNVADADLRTNSSGAEVNPNVNTQNDILSNGFKVRHAGGAYNASGGTYIFAAFAEHPFKNALAR